MSNSPTVLQIDSSAIKHNLRYFKSKIQESTKLLVVIKAFAYGSDAIAIAKLLEQQNVDYLAVAYTKEGVSLRKANIKLPILVLHPQAENFESIIKFNLEPNLYNFRTLNYFNELVSANNLKEYPVHIKINTGMNRLGFKEKDIVELQSEIKKLKNVKIVSYYSHLAASEDISEKNFTKHQIDSFIRITNLLNESLSYTPLKHISNTSGILNYPEAQFDMVRLGIGFYGFGNDNLETAELKNVCNLKTKISQIQFLEKGDTVSYNRKFTSTKNTKIGVLPLGYADGLNRNLGNKFGSVYIKNQKAPIIGTICMDMTMIDLNGIDCKEGDEVIVFNHQDHVLELAKTTTTIPYEILTSISQRVRREII